MQNDHCWIETYCGKKINPFDPHPEDIKLLDIAHALSMKCRFVGHCRSFYSIARHSINVYNYIESPALRVWGLFHDAAEAYFVDIARPMKKYFQIRYAGLPDGVESFEYVEHNLLDCIGDRLGIGHYTKLSVDDLRTIKQADDVMLATEAVHFWGEAQIKEWSLTEKRTAFSSVNFSTKPEQDKAEFLDICLRELEL